MARVKVKLPTHDCSTPNMVERVVIHEEPVNGFWGRFFGRVRTHRETIYRAKEAQWTCPVCDAQWNFGYMLPHMWTCTSRPEKWEWRNI